MKMIWSGYRARKGKIEIAYKIWTGNLKGKDHLTDLGEGGRITLK